MKLPVIALVGCSNVGKSTLFNRLIGKRKALVSNVKNLTRDRNYHQVEWEDNQQLVLVDTGGIEHQSTDQNFSTLIMQQVKLALEEADLILFVTDGKLGLTVGDEIFIEQIRKLSKPLFVVVNKIDFQDPDLMTVDFRGLGYPVFAISAEHNIGINALKTAILAILPKVNLKQEVPAIKIMVFGKPNVGKSTFINCLSGENRVIASKIAGTTRDYVEVPLVYNGQAYCFIDTAGIRKKHKVNLPIEQLASLKAYQLLKEVEAVLLLIDATIGITEQDISLAGEVWAQGKLILIVFNKVDLLTLEQKKQLATQVKESLSFLPLIDCLWISAVKKIGIERLFKKINVIYQQAHQVFKTSHLNQLLIKAITHHHPPLVNGRPVKIRYVHFGHYDPITFILHGVRVKELPDSYLRYLERCFREALKLNSVPIRLIFEEKN